MHIENFDTLTLFLSLLGLQIPKVMALPCSEVHKNTLQFLLFEHVSHIKMFENLEAVLSPLFRNSGTINERAVCIGSNS